MGSARQGGRGAAWGGGLALGMLLAAPVLAEDAASPGEGAAAPPVALEKLLKLPKSLDYSIQSRGGATRGEWRARFASRREALEKERADLDEAQRELEEVAGGSDAWQVAPPIPGATAGEAPLDFGLRQRIRRHREEIERLQRELLSLEVEANLADVPPDWRE